MSIEAPVFNFQTQIDKVSAYNELFVQWLESKNNIKYVRKALLEQDKQGIDYFIGIVGNEKEIRIQLKVEFRTDETGNIPIETISQAYSHKNSKIGAEFEYEEVDYIFYFMAYSGNVIMLKIDELLGFVIEDKNFKTFKNRSTKNENDGVVYYTMYFLVPLDKIKHLVRWRGNIDITQ